MSFISSPQTTPLPLCSPPSLTHPPAVNPLQCFPLHLWRICSVDTVWAAQGKCDTWQPLHNDWCHLPHFNLLFQVMDRCQEGAETLCHKDVDFFFLFFSVCLCILTSCLGVTVSILATWGTVINYVWFLKKWWSRQDWLGNVWWHGDRAGLLQQLVN